MLIITIQVNARPGQAVGIKEDLAMYLERYGDARVLTVKEPAERPMEQMTIGGGTYREEERMPRVRR